MSPKFIFVSSFKYNGVEYHCALVDWFSQVGDSPDEDMGKWVVKWDYDIYDRETNDCHMICDACPPKLLFLLTYHWPSTVATWRI